MNETDQRATPRVPHGWRAWIPSYWTSALLALALGELLVWWGFDAALAADRANRAGDCLDECLGTFVILLYWGAMFVIWPIVWAITAVTARIIWKHKR